jgi:hypothetical protein
MKRIGIVPALLVALAAGAAARGSERIGGFMLVDKVALSPSDSPTTIQVWGAFSQVTEDKGASYGAPQRGYLYFKAPAGKEAACRKEWNDLKKAAGTGQVVGYGSNFDRKGLGAVRKSSERPQSPDEYPLAIGLAKFRPDTNYAPVRNLLALPAPRTPAEGDAVPAGRVTLVAGNMADATRPKAKYVFELRGPDGDKEAGTVDAGKKETKWAPKLQLKAGKKYTWRVHATEGRWQGPVATATFTVKESR